MATTVFPPHAAVYSTQYALPRYGLSEGFLNTKNISAYQADLGIEVILALFSKTGLTQLFTQINSRQEVWSENAQRIVALQDHYIHTIDEVVSFLQGKNPTLAHLICQEDFLPEASRFEQLDDLEWAFGAMGTQDKAKHLATLYLEDLSDLITECVDPHFGFSRYAERLGRSANSFDELYEHLQAPYTYVDALLIALLKNRMAEIAPKLVCISVPFPGNLYSAFRCAQWVKQHCPGVKTAMGGGFANTELRSLSEPRVFEFFDFITLDDGEAPITSGTRGWDTPGRTPQTSLCLSQWQGRILQFQPQPRLQAGGNRYARLQRPAARPVYLRAGSRQPDAPHVERWPLEQLTTAHGCYWGKCTFCDISLDYIKVYEPVAAQLLCDRMGGTDCANRPKRLPFCGRSRPAGLYARVGIRDHQTQAHRGLVDQYSL